MDEELFGSWNFYGQRCLDELGDDSAFGVHGQVLGGATLDLRRFRRRDNSLPHAMPAQWHDMFDGVVQR